MALSFALALGLSTHVRAESAPVTAPTPSTPASTPAATPASHRAPPPPAAPEDHDVLVFADGDRTQGEFLRREGNIIVFRSIRFGELRVPAEIVKVIRAAPDEGEEVATTKKGAPPKATSAAAQTPTKSETPESASPWFAWSRWTSPAALTESLRNLFGQWHGRFSFASSVITDTTNRSDLTIEGKLSRKWKTDEFDLGAHYEFARSNGLTSADILKTSASWRHDLTPRYFITYRPTLEWNRDYRTATLKYDYVLLQDEFGAGVNLVARKNRKLRVGVAENIFDLWAFTDPPNHDSSHTESLFSEIELLLPWRMSITDRGIWYYGLSTREQGWENRFELNKKLTETLSLGLRQEYRQNNPDVRLSNYSLWRVLLGFDF